MGGAVDEERGERTEASAGNVAPAPSSPVAHLLPADWTTQVADRIVTTVDAVRDRTTVPAQKLGRAVVYALPLATVGLFALVLVIITVFRLLYEAVAMLPIIDDRSGRSIWVVDLALGLILLVAGLWLASRRGDEEGSDAPRR